MHTFSSCTKDIYDNSIQGFRQVETDLLEKFGQGSYFTDITIVQNKKQQLEINLLVTSNPYTYKMEGWNYKNGNWKKITEIDLELVKGNVIDYLYSINKEVNLIKIGHLVSLSTQRTKEKGHANVLLDRIIVLSPNDGNKSKMGYKIRLSSSSNTFDYIYNLQGDLLTVDIL